MSKLAYITYFALTGAVAVVLFGHKMSGPFFEDILNEYGQISLVPWLKSYFIDEKVFTREELKLYNGIEKKELYLAILGKVYDVSKARNYYGPGESYYGFVGKDGSKAFVTGDFSPGGLTDEVDDLPLGDLGGLMHWVDLYKNNYEYKGKLAGRFYDEYGKPTLYLYKIHRRIREAIHVRDNQVKLDRKYPGCNLEWNKETGRTVWCSLKSGGVSRDWVGVPRKFYETGSKNYRCACVPLGVPEDNVDGRFEIYEDCAPYSEKCILNIDEHDL
ncbi:heme Hypothetical protein [Nesidiocoris tenuis]|uniref:Cytochrome b5 heme-binding domain-containing protein n=1 Tax=Nesidiocoris tenuis TaxID=355587 RepID=A0ABN7AZ67_9HEMI|nr:heme Hypothetical protein [Nesidiocoris tenuis]